MRFKQAKKTPYHVIFYSTLALIIGFTILSVSLLYRAQKDRFWAEHRRKMEVELTLVTASVYQMESSVRGFLLSRDQRVIENYAQAQSNAFAHIRKAYGLTMDVWSQVETLNKLNSLVLERQTLLTRLMEVDRLPEPERTAQVSRLVYRGHEVMSQIQATVNSMIDYEQRLYEDRTKSINRYEATSVGLVTAFGFITAIISLIGYIRLINENKQRDRAEQDRLRSAEILKQSEMRYRNLNDSSNDAIIITDSRGSIISWNKMAQSIFGYSPSDAYRTSLELILPDPQIQLLINNKTSISHIAITRFETIGKTKKGKEVPLELSLSTWEIKNEVFTGLTVRDITEQKRMLEKLDGAIKDLQRSNEDLEQFAYVASHDLQEPLRKIQAFSDRFMAKFQDKDNIPGQEYLTPMRNAAERMQILIQDLLSFSRLTPDQSQQQKVDLNQIVKQVLEDLQLVIEEKNASIVIDELPILSKAIKAQLIQLFLNLLVNALKFSKAGESPVIEIRHHIIDGKNTHYPGVELSNKIQYHQIEVIDHGIGFDNKYLDKIFTIFQRLHGRNEYIGTGIGLAVCKKICMNHKGFITATAEVNKGATFILFFPKSN